MRTVVMAYQDIGFVCLDELLALGAQVLAVVTHLDDPAEEVWFRSVAERAREAGVPVLMPDSVNRPEVVHEIARMAPEIMFSFYFRQILSPELLRLPPRGALNLHGSLLPRYRGRCPVNWVLINGEHETGVTLHYMEARPDRGDIVAQRAVAIDEDDTATSLNRKLGQAARMLLREVYPRLDAGTAPRVAQDHARATCFPGRRPEDGRLIWEQSARDLYNLVRAVTAPYPGAFTTWRGEHLHIWWARPLADASPGARPGEILEIRPGSGVVVATGGGTLLLERVQLRGGGERRGDELASEIGLRPGERLGGDDENREGA